MATHISVDEALKTIRPAIKRICPRVSVRRGAGTAYGWIEVSPGQGRSMFTEAERAALVALTGTQPGGNFLVISPDEREWMTHRLGAKLSVLGV